jgi:hypothetical protein
MRTRADMLRFAIAFALIKSRKAVRGLRQGLTVEERYAVADAVVWRLQEHGDPWKHRCLSRRSEKHQPPVNTFDK